MGAGIDLEAAAAGPYHAMEGTTGDRRRGCCSAACSAVLNSDGCLIFKVAAGSITVYLMAALAIFALMPPEPSFSVHLTGYDGIDPGRAARLVSPSFNITLRMNHTCVDSAHLAVIIYSGVALGWAGVEPRDCAKGRWARARDIEVVARGHRVGLSQSLRDRMASDWRSGTVELDIDVIMDREGRHSDNHIPLMFLEKVKMMDKNNNR